MEATLYHARRVLKTIQDHRYANEEAGDDSMGQVSLVDALGLEPVWKGEPEGSIHWPPDKRRKHWLKAPSLGKVADNLRAIWDNASIIKDDQLILAGQGLTSILRFASQNIATSGKARDRLYIDADTGPNRDRIFRIMIAWKESNLYKEIMRKSGPLINRVDDDLLGIWNRNSVHEEDKTKLADMGYHQVDDFAKEDFSSTSNMNSILRIVDKDIISDNGGSRHVDRRRSNSTSSLDHGSMGGSSVMDSRSTVAPHR
jgi:hypothetical protein